MVYVSILFMGTCAAAVLLGISLVRKLVHQEAKLRMLIS